MFTLLACTLTAFGGFHAWLTAHNFTTIEFLEKRGCNPPPGYVNRYDLGWWGNVTAVLGGNPLLWLLPVRWGCEGDGTTWQLNQEWYPSVSGGSKSSETAPSQTPPMI